MSILNEKADSYHYSSSLFTDANGCPLDFRLQPCPLRQVLRPLIERGGGTCGCAKGIRLLAPGEKSYSGDCYSSKFVFDCLEQNQLLDISKYRVAPGQMADHSTVEPVTVRISGSKGRSKYTIAEELDILHYLLDNQRCLTMGGNKVWQELESHQVTSHTWQSMRDHFLKVIYRDINKYGLTAEQKKCLTESCEPVSCGLLVTSKDKKQSVKKHPLLSRNLEPLTCSDSIDVLINTQRGSSGRGCDFEPTSVSKPHCLRDNSQCDAKHSGSVVGYAVMNDCKSESHGSCTSFETFSSKHIVNPSPGVRRSSSAQREPSQENDFKCNKTKRKSGEPDKDQQLKHRKTYSKRDSKPAHLSHVCGAVESRHPLHDVKSSTRMDCEPESNEFADCRDQQHDQTENAMLASVSMLSPSSGNRTSDGCVCRLTDCVLDDMFLEATDDTGSQNEVTPSQQYELPTNQESIMKYASVIKQTAERLGLSDKHFIQALCMNNGNVDEAIYWVQHGTTRSGGQAWEPVYGDYQLQHGDDASYLDLVQKFGEKAVQERLCFLTDV